MLISDIKRVLAGLGPETRARVRVVLVSLQPAIDTPAVLQRVQTERGLEGPQWTLMRGDAVTTRTVAAALGVRWRENGDGSIDHSSKILLVDDKGVPLATRDAIGSSVVEFAAAIESAVQNTLKNSNSWAPAKRPNSAQQPPSPKDP